MDKASDFESEDCGFDPHRGQFSGWIKHLLGRSIYWPVPGGLYPQSIVGSVVEFSPATRETGVRFPDNADLFRRYCNRSKIWARPTLRVGFEPTREDPIWFRVKRLNHSAIAAQCRPVHGNEVVTQCRWSFLSTMSKLLKITLRVGFEPTREDPIRFQV